MDKEKPIKKRCEYQQDINVKNIYGCNNCNLDISFCIESECEFYNKEDR
jgi:hypothetical protein